MSTGAWNGHISTVPFYRQVLCIAKLITATPLLVAVIGLEALTPGHLSAQRLTLPLLGDFDDGWDALWTERVLARKRSRYDVVQEEGGLVLKATSDRSASGLWRTVSFDYVASGTLSWRWKVTRSIQDNVNELERNGDDYAARLFVVFGDDPFARRARALCYVWAARQPVGSTFRSPYVSNVAMVVLQSGDARAGTWIREQRDVVADYREAFGEAPATIAAVALMIDTDDTQSRATAWFDDMVLELQRE